jgi:hypothetical protein
MWRHSLRGTIEHNNRPRCILACDALAYRPSVEVNGNGLQGLDVSDFAFDDRLFESLLSSRKVFLDFVKTHWDQVLHAAFVFQVQPLNQFELFAEKLMTNALLLFANTNFYIMCSRKQRSSKQKLQAVASSSPRIILSSKSEMKAVTVHAALDLIKQHLGELLGRTRILSEDLKLLVVQVCDTTRVPFEGAHPLK